MKQRATKIWASILCIALTLALFAGCAPAVTKPPLPDRGEGGVPVISDPVVQTSGGMTVKASDSQNGMISTLSVFTVTTEKDMTEEELLATLNLTPETDVSVTKSGECSFEITPSGPLEEGTLYRFTLGDPDAPTGSFVFQTESELTVRQVFPADKSTNVPVNTGIEITFPSEFARKPELIEFQRDADGKMIITLKGIGHIENR